MIREDLAWLLNLANDMRRQKGDSALKDLPTSIPEDPKACIIANAFNYGCEVVPRSPGGPHKGEITFTNGKDLLTYMKITGASVIDPFTNTAELTDDLNQVALDFDAGKYHEYDWKFNELPEWEL